MRSAATRVSFDAIAGLAHEHRPPSGASIAARRDARRVRHSTRGLSAIIGAHGCRVQTHEDHRQGNEILDLQHVDRVSEREYGKADTTTCRLLLLDLGEEGEDACPLWQKGE